MGNEELDLVECVLDCWPGCKYAKRMKEKIAKGYALDDDEYEKLMDIWNERIKDEHKVECGYEEGDWE